MNKGFWNKHLPHAITTFLLTILVVFVLWRVDTSAEKSFFTGMMTLIAGGLTVLGVYLTLRNQAKQLKDERKQQQEERRLSIKPYLFIPSERAPGMGITFKATFPQIRELDVVPETHVRRHLSHFRISNSGSSPAQVECIKIIYDELLITLLPDIKPSIGTDQTILAFFAPDNMICRTDTEWKVKLIYRDVFKNLYITDLECSKTTSRTPQFSLSQEYIVPNFICETIEVSKDEV